MHLVIGYGTWGKIEVAFGAIIGAIIGMYIYNMFLFNFIMRFLCPV